MHKRIGEGDKTAAESGNGSLDRGLFTCLAVDRIGLLPDGGLSRFSASRRNHQNTR